MTIWPEQENIDDEIQIEEYDLTSSPNDFNILTIFSFIESGAVKIPGFQRNYVWDIKRASKLIESIILGLPVPQIFLYEESRNKFLVIDGQQRLMTIYYFIKQRFPKKEMRATIRRIFSEKGNIPDNIFNDDKYFEKFNLKLDEISNKKPNKFSNLNYSTLDDYKTQFDLRTIRNVIVKQNIPKEDDSSIYEMFNRLNTGGINLTPQEIRASLYHSDFYDMLYQINLNSGWRRLLKNEEPDLHMRDIEILLRVFAMLYDGENYSSSMAKFLNLFSKKAKSFTFERNNFFREIFTSFINATQSIPEGSFINKNGKFSITILESVFASICEQSFKSDSTKIKEIDINKLNELRSDPKFFEHSQAQSTNKSNVEGRLKRAKEILNS